MIHFLTENIELPEINERETANWIKRVVVGEGKTVGEINYIFCDDKKILEVNRQFLEHDYFTDVITFDYSVSNQVAGDIFISLETVSDNAKNIGTNYSNELNRVIIHGVLHLCGYKDKTPDEEKKMRQLEDNALKLIL